MFTQEQVIERLKRYRSTNGITLRGMEELTGVGYGTISRAEHGQSKLDTKNLIALADFFKMENGEAVPIKNDCALTGIYEAVRTDPTLDLYAKDFLCELMRKMYHQYLGR